MLTEEEKVQRTRIKICGFTQAGDARAAIDAGVDALGFVFYEKSKRAVTAGELQWLADLPPFVQLVGLFVDPKAEMVADVLAKLPLDLLQFHGLETAAFCRQFHRPYIKAVPMQGKSQRDAVAYMQGYTTASAFLLDNYGAGEIGGSGSCFDWQKIPTSCPKPLVMAGGLRADNVGEIIRQCRPYAVDVSSGVELSAGNKCPHKIREFVKAVQQADATK